MPSKCALVFHLTFCPVYHVLDLLFLSDAQVGLYNDVNLNLGGGEKARERVWQTEYRPSSGNSRNAGAVRMECSLTAYVYQSVGSRDGASEISRDPRTKRLQTRRESLAMPSKHTNNNF